MPENKEFSKNKAFYGYMLPKNSLIVSIIGIFAAFTCVLTFIVPITIPATQGYINLGDIGVMISGLLFGPIIGGIAGGIGSALADLFIAPIYAIPTLIIKGLEGLIVGLIANPKKHYLKLNYRDFLAVIFGGLVMVFGYLLVEIVLYGFPSALFEFFFNGTIQFGLGVSSALIFAFVARKNIVNSLPQVFDKVFLQFSSPDISIEDI